MATHQLPPVESLVLIIGQVRVSNGFASPLLLHCSSDTVDLGNQTVRGGAHFEWTVRVVVGKSNIYSCDLLSGDKNGRFVLFDPKKEISDEGFDVPDIPDDIDPYEIDVKPFKLDQHPPGSELWKEVEELADQSKPTSVTASRHNIDTGAVECSSADQYWMNIL
ncbi:hypothetical protein RHSIM_Rhsim02G0052700 [Rhododendron simsii]|uniref:S-protein homolog n=1 Tax=Rhododendron simsii TaxID=118357 RepID=A0A834H818_RHOSS|nr:hypothetical protein RHSIM_Rhsim02G0052700 [Rhododendron simsii]